MRTTSASARFSIRREWPERLRRALPALVVACIAAVMAWRGLGQANVPSLALFSFAVSAFPARL